MVNTAVVNVGCVHLPKTSHFAPFDRHPERRFLDPVKRYWSTGTGSQLQNEKIPKTSTQSCQCTCEWISLRSSSCTGHVQQTIPLHSPVLSLCQMFSIKKKKSDLSELSCWVHCVNKRRFWENASYVKTKAQVHRVIYLLICRRGYS